MHAESGVDQQVGDAAEAFDVACVQEAIAEGQSVARYTLEARTGGTWTSLIQGTTIGHKKLDRFPPVAADRGRLTITEALDTPRIANLALYRRDRATVR